MEFVVVIITRPSAADVYSVFRPHVGFSTLPQSEKHSESCVPRFDSQLTLQIQLLCVYYIRTQTWNYIGHLCGLILGGNTVRKMENK
jgi:hypothetical protein